MNKDSDFPEIEIRAFSSKDLEPCAELYAYIFGRPPWNEAWTVDTAEALIKKITEKKGFSGITAMYNNTGAGYLLGYLLNSAFLHNRIYYINELFVDAEFQNKKIGKRLVADMLKDLRNIKTSWVFLLTKEGSIAEKFYESMGFKRVLPGLKLNKKIIMFCRLK